MFLSDVTPNASQHNILWRLDKTERLDAIIKQQGNAAWKAARKRKMDGRFYCSRRLSTEGDAGYSS